MSAYNRQRCFDNIYYLAREKNIKIGDLESSAGVSAGYLSRLNKEDVKTNPGIEVLAAIATRLEVTIDALISWDYSHLTASEKYMLSFIVELKKRTLNGEIRWTEQHLSYLQNIPTDEDDNIMHPLFKWWENKLTRICEIDYNSLFNPGMRFSPCDSGYVINIGNTNNVYLMKIGAHEPAEPYPPDYELYLTNQYSVETLCRSDNIFYDELESLYNTITEAKKHVFFKPEVKHAIDNFFARKEDRIDPEDLPF